MVGLVAVDFDMVDFSCALGVIVVLTRVVVLKHVYFNNLAFLVT